MRQPGYSRREFLKLVGFGSAIGVELRATTRRAALNVSRDRISNGRFSSQDVITNSIGMRLALIPPGEFLMGSNETAEALATAYKRYIPEITPAEFEDEYPQHHVKISNLFRLCVHEVTVSQFRRFVDDMNYKTDAESDGKGGIGFDAATGRFMQKPEFTWRRPGFEQSDDHPVVHISWNDANAFCGWLSRKERKSYRLPSEAEWEYACRAGTTTRYFVGDDPEALVTVGNVGDATGKAYFRDRWRSTNYYLGSRDGFVFTAPVGHYKPNAFGLYDMHGNAWEWCADWYDARYYARSPLENPTGPISGAAHVVRGGSWYSFPISSRSSNRFSFNVSYRSDATGFRVKMEA